MAAKCQCGKDATLTLSTSSRAPVSLCDACWKAALDAVRQRVAQAPKRGKSGKRGKRGSR
jgi:hypothetical protein